MNLSQNVNKNLDTPKSKTTGFQKFWKLVSDHKFLFIIFILLGFGVAFLINRYSTPIYVVSTTISVNPVNTNSNPNKLLLQSQGGAEESAVIDKTREVAMVTSLAFIEKTINSLDFKVSYFRKNRIGETELYNKSPFKLSFPDTSALKKLTGSSFEIVFQSREKFSITELSEDEKGGSTVYTVNQPINLKGCPVVVNTTPIFSSRSDVNKVYKFKFEYPVVLAFEFKDQLEFASESPESSVFTITLKTSTPQKGVDFLNEFTKQYIKDKYEEKSRSATQALAFINDQINTVKGTLGGAESNLANFQASNTFSDPNAMTSRNLDALETIENEKFVLRQQDNYFSRVLSDLNSGTGLDQLVSPSSVGVQDAATNNLVQQLADLQIEKNSYAASGNSKNPYVQELDVKINTAKSALAQSLRNLANANRVKISQLNARAGQFQANVYRIPLAQKQFTDIKRTTDFNDGLYQFLMQKRVEAGILKASATVEDKIIEPAYFNSVPLEPKTSRNYIFGFVLGFLIPLGIVKMRAALNKKLTGKEEIQNTTSIPVIGTIYRNLENDPFVINSGTRTAVSESFRMLRSNISHLTKESKQKLILITSTNSGEGKSFTSINLALSFALAKKKTILVNIDLRVPSNAYDPLGDNSNGISNYLEGKTILNKIIQKTSMPYLDYISTGELPVNPAELLMEDRLESLFDELRENYDYIIIDTPPLGVVADPLILANYSDLNVLVVRERYTLKESLFELEEMYKEGKIKDVVMVLNDVRLERKGYKNAYYYKK